MFVAMVTAFKRPAWAMIVASFACCFALSHFVRYTGAYEKFAEKLRLFDGRSFRLARAGLFRSTR